MQMVVPNQKDIALLENVKELVRKGECGVVIVTNKPVEALEMIQPVYPGEAFVFETADIGNEVVFRHLKASLGGEVPTYIATNIPEQLFDGIGREYEIVEY